MRNTLNDEQLKDKLADGDKGKIEAAMQETLGWLEATIEIDSLFEGIDYSCSLSRALFEKLCIDYSVFPWTS